MPTWKKRDSSSPGKPATNVVCIVLNDLVLMVSCLNVGFFNINTQLN